MDLMKHQREALERFSRSDELALFFDMRLGKTLTTYHWVKARRFRDVLVIAPLSAHEGWHDLGFDPVTYQKLVKDPSIYKMRWDCVVLDESTMIKNPRSKAAKVAQRHLARARGRAILTGIPTPEKLMDAYMQMAFLRGGTFMGQTSVVEVSVLLPGRVRMDT
jgi:hypothetical protein